jgi:hypothetical protein
MLSFVKIVLCSTNHIKTFIFSDSFAFHTLLNGGPETSLDRWLYTDLTENCLLAYHFHITTSASSFIGTVFSLAAKAYHWSLSRPCNLTLNFSTHSSFHTSNTELDWLRHNSYRTGYLWHKGISSSQISRQKLTNFPLLTLKVLPFK